MIGKGVGLVWFQIVQTRLCEFRNELHSHYRTFCYFSGYAQDDASIILVDKWLIGKFQWAFSELLGRMACTCYLQYPTALTIHSFKPNVL